MMHSASLARPASEAPFIPLPEDLEQAHDALSQCALLLERVDSPPMDLSAAVSALALGTFQSELARDAGHPMLSMVRDLAGSAERQLSEAATRLRAAPWTPSPAAGELHASLRQPRVHRVARPNLVAKIRTAKAVVPEVQSPPPEIATPTTFEELMVAVAGLRERSVARARPPAPPPSEPSAPSPLPEVPPALDMGPSPFVSNADKAWSRQRFSEERALGAFEEVLLAWIQRLPIAGERWQSAIFIEQRLLAGVDALAALGPTALTHLDTLTLGNPTRTPAHLAALTMALGCIEGRDALALAERLLHEQESVSPEWADAFGAALALVPHPDASRLAFRYARSPHVAHRALGLRALLR